MDLLPTLKETWWFAVLISLLGGAGVTLGCGGALLNRRIISAVVWGMLTGIFYTAVSVLIVLQGEIIAGEIVAFCGWRVFILSVLAPIGALVTELRINGKT